MKNHFASRTDIIGNQNQRRANRQWPGVEYPSKTTTRWVFTAIAFNAVLVIGIVAAIGWALA